MEAKDLMTERVDTSEDMADMLTKALGRAKFEYLVEKAGMVDVIGKAVTKSKKASQIRVRGSVVLWRLLNLLGFFCRLCGTFAYAEAADL